MRATAPFPERFVRRAETQKMLAELIDQLSGKIPEKSALR